MSDVTDNGQRCKRCKRKLTDQQSVLRGYGRECWRIVHTQPLLIPEVGPSVAKKEPPKKENPVRSIFHKLVDKLTRFFEAMNMGEGYIRVGDEWMTAEEYNLRYPRDAK